MRVLPKNHGGAGQEERGGGEAVAEAPASLGQRRFELGRMGLGIVSGQRELLASRSIH